MSDPMLLRVLQLITNEIGSGTQLHCVVTNVILTGLLTDSVLKQHFTINNVEVFIQHTLSHCVLFVYLYYQLAKALMFCYHKIILVASNNNLINSWRRV